MKRLHAFLSEHRHFYLLLLLIPILLWFQFMEHSLTPIYATQIALDGQIPFIPAFVVPYLFWYAFVAYGIVYVGIHSKKDFYKLLFFLGGGMTVANIIFAVFPNAQELRPAVSSGDPFSTLVKFIYSEDTPTDVCPSIHVINAIAVDAALRHSEAFSEKRFGKAASFILTVLICLSTVFIKQHAILDVAGGIMISVLFYIPLYILSARRAEAKHGPDRGKSTVSTWPGGLGNNSGNG